MAQRLRSFTQKPGSRTGSAFCDRGRHAVATTIGQVIDQPVAGGKLDESGVLVPHPVLLRIDDIMSHIDPSQLAGGFQEQPEAPSMISPQIGPTSQHP